MTKFELGEGRAWSFTASANTTSGVAVYFDVDKVRPTTAVSQHVAGISLIPASAGKVISVLIEGIADVYVTGANIVAGDLLGPGAGGVRERAWSQLNDRRYDLGVALESAAANGDRIKVKLLW